MKAEWPHGELASEARTQVSGFPSSALLTLRPLGGLAGEGS